MNLIDKLFIKCFCKSETVENVLEKIQTGDCIWYINGNDDIKFTITHIDKERKEIIAKTSFKNGYSDPKSIAVHNRNDVHTHLNNQQLFKKVVVEEESCNFIIRYDGGDEIQPYTNFKTTVVISPNAKGYLLFRASEIRNTLFLIS